MSGAILSREQRHARPPSHWPVRAAIAALALAAGAAGAAPPSRDPGTPAAPRALTPQARDADFDAMARAIETDYAFFDGPRARWELAVATWRGKAQQAASRGEFVAALESALSELHDDHVGLSETSPRSPRRVPAETDLWAHWEDGAALVDAVRAFGDADVAGMHPGDVVTRIDGVDVELAVRTRVGAAATERARDWALRHLLAGPRAGSLRLEASDAQGLREVTIERRAAGPAAAPAIAARRMGEARDLGYLRVRDAPSGERLLANLDAELARLGDTRALILDLRDYAGPPSRAATRAFLARFAARGRAWQVREQRGGARTTDTVPEFRADRGAPARRGVPLVVLVNRWTEGEAEALAAGLYAAAGARLVGTAMAGMNGELHRVRLPGSGIELHFPAERVLLPDGTPRAALRPEIEVDLAAPSGGPGDPVLYQALKLLEAAPGGTAR